MPLCTADEAPDGAADKETQRAAHGPAVEATSVRAVVPANERADAAADKPPHRAADATA